MRSRAGSSTWPTHSAVPRSWDRRSGPRDTATPDATALDWRFERIFVFIAIHIGLAFAFRFLPLIATVHSLLCLALGLRWLVRDRTPDRVMMMAGYIMSMEILWRGENAAIFYEYGKYAICLLLILTMLRFRLLRRSTKWALLYFALLTPSILIMPGFDREAIAFNLSGPFTLAVATAFFSSQKLYIPQFKKILVAMIAPCIGLCAMATFFSLSVETFVVHGKAGSAGYPPNQVSSMLGLGGIAAFLYLVLERRSLWTRGLMFALMVWTLAQAAVTLSRGGFWAGLMAVGAASFYLLRERRGRAVVVVRIGMAAILGAYLIFPFADSLTGGVLSERFRSFDSTGRDRIIEGDIKAFKENPVLGVGPGQARVYHARTFRVSSAHTEYTRMLAEHGSLGALALLILFGLCASRALSSHPLGEKAVVAGLTTWALLFMIHAAMRLAAPGFVFGLAAARLFALAPRPSQAVARTPSPARTAPRFPSPADPV